MHGQLLECSGALLNCPDGEDKVVEGAVAAAAFQSLPARWQSALWMAEVQQLDPATIAERLEVNVSSAGALIYRARQGFTEAYLAQHLSRSRQPACAALGPKLARYVRGSAGLIATRQVESHIEECQACSSAVAELSDVNSSLRSLTGPLSMATVAGATATATYDGSATLAVSGLGLGWLAKAAAIAALSMSPLLVSGDASQPSPAASRMAATAAGRANAEADRHTTHTAETAAEPRGRVVADTAAAIGTTPGGGVAPTPGLTDEDPGMYTIHWSCQASCQQSRLLCRPPPMGFLSRWRRHFRRCKHFGPWPFQ